MVQVKRLNIFILLIAMLYGFNCAAGVTFKFSAGTIDAGPLKNKMESNISALLTEINRAGTSRTNLDLSQINMEPAAKTRLTALWEDARFVCDKSTNISKCLNDYQGYQVRAIPITMKPIDSSYSGSTERELTISLNKDGVITGVRPAWELQEDVSKIMHSPGGVADTRQRREILKWLEDYKSFYHEKNIEAITQLFSDNPLILNGSEVMQQRISDDFPVKWEYRLLSKEEYMGKLSRIFKNSKRVDIEVDHISVVMHGAKPNVYGVTLHQKWQTNSYHDEGWLFLLWDFNNPEKPKILYRELRESNESNQQIFLLEDDDSWFIP